jgi:ribonuclease D
VLIGTEQCEECPRPDSSTLGKNQKEKHYIGIDFEFKQVAKENREIALMQINLENDSNIGYIFVLYPPDLTKENYDLLIKLISTPEIIKILHGAESLDIPYIVQDLFNYDK